MSDFSDLPTVVKGRRHSRLDGRECLCGCHRAVGLKGVVVRDADAAKLLSLDPPMAYVAFDVPGPGGGPGRRDVIAYELREIQS